MRYKDLSNAIESINNVANGCGEDHAILLTFHRNKKTARKLAAPTAVTATIVNSYGNIVCSVTMDLLSDALTRIGVDIDLRYARTGVALSSVNGPHACDSTLTASLIASAIEASSIASTAASTPGEQFTEKKLAVDAIVLLKNDIKRQIRESAAVGDYAKAAALRHKSTGITMAMRTALDSTIE